MNKVVELRPIRWRTLGYYESFNRAASECSRARGLYSCVVINKNGAHFSQRECDKWLEGVSHD